MSDLHERLKQILLGSGYDDESGLNKPAERVVRRMLFEIDTDRREAKRISQAKWRAKKKATEI